MKINWTDLDLFWMAKKAKNSCNQGGSLHLSFSNKQRITLLRKITWRVHIGSQIGKKKQFWILKKYDIQIWTKAAKGFELVISALQADTFKEHGHNSRQTLFFSDFNADNASVRHLKLDQFF